MGAQRRGTTSTWDVREVASTLRKRRRGGTSHKILQTPPLTTPIPAPMSGNKFGTFQLIFKVPLTHKLIITEFYPTGQNSIPDMNFYRSLFCFNEEEMCIFGNHFIKSHGRMHIAMELLKTKEAFSFFFYCNECFQVRLE